MRKGVLIVFCLALLSLIAFLMLDFRIAWSSNTVSTELGTFSMGNHGNQEEGVTRASELALYVAGNDSLADTLRRDLIDQLKVSLKTQNVRVLDSLPEDAGQPVVIVEVSERHINCYAIYSHAQVTARIIYASDGDLSWREQATVIMSNDHPTIRIRGRVEIDDTTKGLITIPAYQRHLGEQIAGQVGEELARTLSR